MKNSRIATLLFVIFLLSSCSPLLDQPQPASPPVESTIPEPAATSTVVPTNTIAPTHQATDTIHPTPTNPPQPTPTEPPAGSPGIILFIGDGMGVNQRLAATWLVSGEGGLLVMDNMPVHGLAQTASANDPVTDSAAATTAMATGTLTNNTYLAVDPALNTLTTILELAQVSGWAVGLVSTVQLAHATPAAFASHIPSRTNLPEIARQIMAHKVDVLLGGGEDDFFTTSQDGCYPGRGHQRKENDLVSLAVEEGYTYICTAEELQALEPSQTSRVLGLFGGENMQAPYTPSLAQMTQTAISILSQDPDGFFLMVEAGQIDQEAHKNVAQGTIINTVGLDTAVAMAQIYALQNPNTLIIVAADHETGGMRLNRDGAGSYRQDGPFSMPDGTSFWVDWSTTSHTSEPIPVTAQGPYSEMLVGEYPLTKIFEAMSAMLFNAGQ